MTIQLRFLGLNIKGSLISADTMNTQKKICDKIIAKEADYVLCVKANHKKLRDEIADYFHKIDCDNPEFIQSYQEVDKEHGLVGQRQYCQLMVDEWINGARNALRVNYIPIK